MTITLSTALVWTVWTLLAALPLLIAFIFWLGRTTRTSIIVAASFWVVACAAYVGWGAIMPDSTAVSVVRVISTLFVGVFSVSLAARRIRAWETHQATQNGVHWRFESKQAETPSA